MPDALAQSLEFDVQRGLQYGQHDGVQFLRRRGQAIKVDPDRIGLLGDSAGAHLTALVALAGDKPPFVGAY